MSTTVRRELVAIALAVAIVTTLRGRLPRVVGVGDLLMVGAVVLLVQGLARDLARLRGSHATRAALRESRRVTCICVESTLGVVAILSGALLTLAWAPWPVRIAPVAWPLALASVMLFGLATRDVVLDWRARRVRREPDHAAVVRFRA